MWLYKVARAVLYLPIKLVFPTKVYGKKPIPDGKCIVAGNHLTGFDSLIWAVNFKRTVTFLSKEELWGNWFTKWLFKNLGSVPIARGGSDFVAMKKIIATLNEDKAVALYPEGTRNKTAPGELLPFKGGVSMFALKTGADILPVVLLNPPKPFKKNYMLIGDVIKVEKPEGKLTSEVTEEFTQMLQCKMGKQLHELQSRAHNINTVKKIAESEIAENDDK
ncbi:MAG: lysophospholipid acyltransferase family protein [Bacillota bacterium]